MRAPMLRNVLYVIGLKEVQEILDKRKLNAQKFGYMKTENKGQFSVHEKKCFAYTKTIHDTSPSTPH